MGNKADVVKGLAKRCNENWKVAPTSDIVRFLFSFFPFIMSEKIYISGYIYRTFKAT